MRTIAIVLNLSLFATYGYLLGYHNGVNTPMPVVDQNSVDHAVFMALMQD